MSPGEAGIRRLASRRGGSPIPRYPTRGESAGTRSVGSHTEKVGRVLILCPLSRFGNTLGRAEPDRQARRGRHICGRAGVVRRPDSDAEVLASLQRSLVDIVRFGIPRIPNGLTTRPDGQVVAAVYPNSLHERINQIDPHLADRRPERSASPTTGTYRSACCR